jgi:hypothetical protein
MTGITLPQYAGNEGDNSRSFSSLISTNRLRVVPGSGIKTEPVRVFEALASVGEVQQIDFTSTQVDSIVLVTYFDLRSARRALMELRSEFNLLEPDSSYDSSAARSVRISRDSNISLDEAMGALSKYGEIERLSFVGTDQLLVEFFDTRSPIAVMAALSCVNSQNRVENDVGGEARRAHYSDPPAVKVLLMAAANTADDHKSQTSVNTNKPTPSCYGSADMTEFQFDSIKILSGEERRTTLMIRNIPNKYSQKVLMKLIDSKFKDKYDFFYLPIDYKNKCNVGYAFINFNDGTNESMVEFHALFNDKKWEKFNSEKVCKITFARLQGQDALIDHFKSSSVMQQHKQLRPFFVKHTSHINTTPSTCTDNGGLHSPPPGLQLTSFCDGESFIGSETGSQVSTALGANGSKNPNTVEGSINLSLIES